MKKFFFAFLLLAVSCGIPIALTFGENRTASAIIAPDPIDTGESDPLPQSSDRIEDPELTDISGHWAEEYINQLYGTGIVSGYDNGKFGPDDKLTRAQIVKIALIAFHHIVGGEETSTFSDIGPNEWFTSYVDIASGTLGIVKGYSDNTFRPNADVTRAEALKIILTAAGITDFNPGSSNFSDVTSTDWFKDYAAYAKKIGLVTGYSDGTFRGNQSITRAEACKIIVQLMDYLAQQE